MCALRGAARARLRRALRPRSPAPRAVNGSPTPLARSPHDHHHTPRTSTSPPGPPSRRSTASPCPPSPPVSPAARHLSAELRMTEGAQNWPFLIWMTRPVRAAAATRSVWRQRKAGIWMMSATAATASACPGSWMSVTMGTPYVAFTLASTLWQSSGGGWASGWVSGWVGGVQGEWVQQLALGGGRRGAPHRRPSSMPGPRNDAALVRLALSKEDLNTSLMPRLSTAASGSDAHTSQRRRGRQWHCCCAIRSPSRLQSPLRSLDHAGPMGGWPHAHL